jgi:hypothetical protein
MIAILTLFVGKMMLVVEIEQPLLMGCQQVFSGLRPLEMPVGEPSLRVNYVEYSRRLLKALQEEGARSPHNIQI